MLRHNPFTTTRLHVNPQVRIHRTRSRRKLTCRRFPRVDVVAPARYPAACDPWPPLSFSRFGADAIEDHETLKPRIRTADCAPRRRHRANTRPHRQAWFARSIIVSRALSPGTSRLRALRFFSRRLKRRIGVLAAHDRRVREKRQQHNLTRPHSGSDPQNLLKVQNGYRGKEHLSHCQRYCCRPGKSTTTGRLYLSAGGIPEREIEKLRAGGRMPQGCPLSPSPSTWTGRRRSASVV